MVGAKNLVMNVGGFEVGAEARTDEKVIDAPTNVVFAGARPVAPPGIALFVGVERAEGVD